MAALKPEIIRDTLELINFYQKNLAFRKRFDLAVKRNINVTYRSRPLKLYFEVLASVNSAKYKKPYHQVRRLIRQDNEGIAGKVLKEITPKDLANLNQVAKKAEKNINATEYPEAEIEKINQIEQIKSSSEKRETYQKRLEESTYLADTQPQPSQTPTSGPPQIVQKISKKVLEPAKKTVNKMAFTKSLVGGAEKTLAKLGLGTAARTAVSFAAKIGLSALTGVATAGVGFVIGVVITAITTFGSELKKLFKYILWITIGLVVFIMAMFVFQRGMKQNSLLPPYEIGMLSRTPTITPTPGPITPGDIYTCTFYRGGDSTPGLKFNIPEWPALITAVASKVGIPPSVLAAILRVECLNCFSSSNPEYISNDYDAHTNGLVYGVMQFYPPTFESVYNSNKDEMRTKFAKTSVKTTIDLQNKMAPADVLRIYSIKDSLIAAAFKIRADAGMNPPYTKEAVDKIVKAYFTQCAYQQGGKTFNYCDDVWKSYQECLTGGETPTIIPTPPPIANHACVVSDRYIPFPGSYAAIGRGDFSYVCGHSRPIYNAIDAGIYPGGGDSVFAVTNGLVENVTNSIGGPALWLNGDDGYNYYYAHLKINGLVVGRVIVGQLIGFIAAASDTYAKNNGVAHVHFSAGTPGNPQTLSNPSDIPAGRLLDSWCNIDVCRGQPNTPY